MNKKNSMILVLTLFLCVLFAEEGFSQGMGQSLTFQGLFGQNGSSVKAQALGNAFTAINDGLNSIYINPAGLAGADGLQASISFKSYNRKSFERQQFGPQGGSWGILELIFAGYYEPHPEDDGMPSNKISYDLSEFQIPETGVEYFSEKYAQWVNEKTDNGLNNISAAIPLKLWNREFVFALAYSDQDIYDFDRNDHILGLDGKTDAQRRPLNNDWYKYLRTREGNLYFVNFAAAAKVTDNFNLGARLQYMSGQTNDMLFKNKFAHYDIRTTPNVYTLWHNRDTLDVQGTSSYDLFKFSLGTIYQTKQVSVGANINLPYRLNRDFDYRKKTTFAVNDSTLNSATVDSSGSTKLTVPFSASFGFAVHPTSFFTISMDYEVNLYAKGSYESTDTDSTFFYWKWPNQHNIHFGIEYKPFHFLSLIAGYVYQQELIRPWDHFRMDVEAPTSDVYSAGLSLRLPAGTLDAAFQYHVFHYIDYYDFHKDYSTIERKNILVGYTITF